MSVESSGLNEHSYSAQGQLRLALRPPAAAAALGISERKLWEITADKTSGIPYVKLGKAVLYPVAPLEKWLAQRATGAPSL